MNAAKPFKAIITDVIDLSPTTKNFRLEIIDEKIKKEFNFMPGQFIIIDFKVKDEDGKEKFVKRSFSIASSPEDKGYIDLCIKLTLDGKITPILFQKEIGTVLDCSGAYGNFFYQHSEGRQVIFSMVNVSKTIPTNQKAILKDIKIDVGEFVSYFIKRKNDSSNSFVTLFFSFRGSKQFLYKKELEDYENKHTNKFKIITSNTDMNEKKWKGLYGRMQEHLPVFINNCDNKDVYICGPPEFVTEIENKLIYLGFTKNQIKKEVWD